MMGDPKEAAEMAQEAGDSFPDTEDTTEDVSSRKSGILSKLFDGQADGPPIKKVETEYTGGDRGLAHIVRACIRMGDGNGLPPIAEAGLGAGLKLLEQSDMGGMLGKETAEEQETNEQELITSND